MKFLKSGEVHLKGGRHVECYGGRCTPRVGVVCGWQGKQKPAMVGGQAGSRPAILGRHSRRENREHGARRAVMGKARSCRCCSLLRSHMAHAYPPGMLLLGSAEKHPPTCHHSQAFFLLPVLAGKRQKVPGPT